MKVTGKILILPECVYEASACLPQVIDRYLFLDAVCGYALYGERFEVKNNTLQGMLNLAYDIMDNYEPEGIIIQHETVEE